MSQTSLMPAALLDKATKSAIANSRHNHYLFLAANSGDAELMLAEAIELLADPKQTSVRVEAKDGALGIDDFRQISSLYTLKSSGRPALIIVSGASSISVEAQNFLLKTLEEAGSRVKFLLAATPALKLLPTIHSRFETINYRLPKLGELSDAQRALLRASGYSVSTLSRYEAGELAELEQAKQWLGLDTLARIGQASKLKERSEALSLLRGLQLAIFSMVTRAADNGDKQQLAKALSSLKQIELCEKRIAANANLRLCLSQLAIRV